ncbi:DNA repair protein RecN [Euzebya rosea]|uniref:DNA repair protein RecN n=1 Tax=Euzebya rosea TaxID=2052804 RepID=UPI000D3EE18A|nr:DNA repair protein RecN [Euzebya rosea]
MLTDLEISDLGIIDEVSLALGPGLNVLTGETGAGKTMVVSALQWLLGGRADRDKVRSGARAAIVQARLVPVPASATDWIDPEDEDLVVSREVGAKGDGDAAAGRSRARIAGRLAPVASLAEVLAPVVEIHSQHEALRLADHRMQRALLDRFGGEAIEKARAAYDVAYGRWTEARTALEDAEHAMREGAREADRLRFEVNEIDAVAPEEGEEDRLDGDIARLEHAESLRIACQTVVDAVQEEGGARDTLGTAVAALRGVVSHDESLADPLERLQAQMAEVQEVAIDLTSYLDGLEADPSALDAILGRRSAIGALLRKYGPSTTQVRAYAAQAHERLALIDGGETRLEELRATLADARQAVDAAGKTLRVARESAGAALCSTVDGHLAELSMPDAHMSVDITPADPGPDGADRIEFLLAANRGQPALPLSRSASGGERSRVALGLRVALADADDTPILVFDEVDAGIGGETALAVGQKLATLARGRQVLCVTHLAQLAAFADAHFVVRKGVTGDRTTTSVSRLADDERAEELSRMLSGTPDSDAALTHAAELLGLAQGSS